MSRVARTEINPHTGPPRASSGRWVAMLVVLLVASPLLLDGAMLCYARWRALFGPMPIVRTPVLDAVGSYLARAAEEIRVLATGPLRHRWRREYALGVMGLSLALGAMLLRANRPR
jgi:hypothetical protein